MNIFTRLYILSVLGLGCFIMQSALANEPVPEYTINPPDPWVEEVQYSITADQDDVIGGIAYRLIDRQTRFQGESTQQYRHFILEVTNQSGLANAAKIQIEFDPEYQQLTIHQARILRQQETIDSLSTNEINVVRTETDLDNDLYNGLKSALLIVNDLRVGDRLEYSYTVKGDNPVFFGRYFATYRMEWPIPVSKNYLSIEVPKQSPIKINVKDNINGDIEGLNDIVEKTTTDGFNKYTWQLENQPQAQTYSDSPGWYSPTARIEVSEFQNWQAVVDWAQQLYQAEYTSSPELTQLVNAIRTESGSKLEQASAALKYVQDNIRYYGIELGVNSHKPSQPEEVITRKYGDCKDKSVLLIYLLNQLGIDAYPALVSTTLQSGIKDRIASPGIFNHVIVKTTLDSQAYWIDPTLSFQSATIQTASKLDYEYALVVADGISNIEPIESSNTSTNKALTTETFDFSSDENQAEKLIVKTSNQGLFSDFQRASVAYNNNTELADSSREYYSAIYPGKIESTYYAIDDQRDDNIVDISEEYKMSRHWEIVGRQERLQTYAHSLKPYVKLPAEMQRDWPVALSYPIELEHNILIEGELDTDYIEEGLEQVTTDYINYQRNVSLDENTLSITHQLYTNDDSVPVEKLDEHYEAIRKIHDFLSYVIIRDHAREDAIKERESRIQSLLRKKLEN